MPALNPGSLNRRILIQSSPPPKGSFGQTPAATWSPVLSCWASIRAATSKEVYAASGFTSDVSHVVTIRFPTVRIRSSMRVLYDGRVFIVQSADDPDEDRAMLKILCLEQNEGTP